MNPKDLGPKDHDTYENVGAQIQTGPRKRTTGPKSGNNKNGRKSPGDGSVFERTRSDGSIYYCAQISMGKDANGKRKRHTVYGTTMKEVKAKLRQVQLAVEARTYCSPTKDTVAQLMSDFLDEREFKGSKPKTIHSYKEIARLYINPLVGHLKLSKLAPLDIERFLRDLGEKGIGPRTREYAFGLLRAALYTAVKWKIIPANPAKFVALPKWEAEEQPAMTVAQVLLLIDAAEHFQYGAVFVLEALTGMRPGELLGLRRKDVDLERGQIYVRQSLTWLPGQAPQLGRPKTKKAVRDLELVEEAVSALKAYMTAADERRRLSGHEPTPDDLVFTTDDGKPLHQSTLRHTFKELLAAAGLPSVFHPYSLRHTYATMQMEAGVHSRVARENMGHKDSRLFEERYTHVHAEIKRESTEKVQILLRDPRRHKKATADE